MDSGQQAAAGEVSQLAACAEPVKNLKRPHPPARRYKATRPAASPQHAHAQQHTHPQTEQKRARGRRDEERQAFLATTTSARNPRGQMEGLIPFVIDVIRRSHERSAYRSVSSDGGSSRGGSRRHLIDYSELPDDAAAASAGADRPSGTLHRRARSEYGETTVGHGRPAPVVAGSAYRRRK